MKKSILLAALFLIGITSFSQDSLSSSQQQHVVVVAIDKPASHLREFDDSALESFRNDSDFQYHVVKRKSESWFDKIISWLLYYFFQSIFFLTGTIPGKILFYGLCAAIIIFAIAKLLNIDVKEMFYSLRKPKEANIKIHEEDIHEISFDQRIEAAYQNKQFRECVRLTFLYALKKLSDNQLIAWKVGKTNDDYLSELKQHPTRLSLQELRLYFDYAWYGDFDVDENTYREIQKVFADFSQKLK